MMNNRLHFALIFLFCALPCSAAHIDTSERQHDEAAQGASEPVDIRLARALAHNGIPPGPKTSFYQYFWGHYPQMRAKGVLPFISEVTEQYGKDGAPVRVYLGMKTLFVISDPEDAHLILSGPDRDKFVKGSSSKYLKSYFVGEGIGFLETKGEDWKVLHDAMLRYLSEGSVRSNYFGLMRQHSQDLVQRLVKLDGATIDLEREMTYFTMGIISSSMLNYDLDEKTASELADSFATVLKFVQYRMANFPFYLPMWFPTQDNRNFETAKKKIELFIQTIIENDKRYDNDNRKPVALITYLRRATETPQPVKPQAGDSEMLQISPARFLGQLKNIFMAGHDTTKHLLTSIFYQLAQHPEAKEKLEHELRRSILAQGGLNDVAQLSKKNLPYLDAIVQEALRINASVPAIARDVMGNVNLRGYTIPKGSVVMISFDALHKNSQTWENPLEFNPDRFLTENNDSEKPKRHRNSLMPFSTGQRMCLGKFFAIQEVKTAIVEMMLAGISFELMPETSWTPLMACTMRLKDGLVMRVRKGQPLKY